ncbi:MAG TPA: PAS domain S-box protein [Terriglobales bacterium]|nr:PAS domain S-box protein [Terriglobales bacterium]
MSAAGSRTILCVDDEPAGLRLRATILQQRGYRVLTATTAEEALAKFKSEPVDLVVSDHMLGRQTGTQMAQEMKKLNPNIPILIVSGTTEIPADIQNADGFLSKLDGPEQLITRIGEMLSRVSTTAAPVSEVNRDLERAYEELRDSQARLAGIVNSTMDAIITVDQNQRIVLFNSSAEKIFGYKSDDMMGQPLDWLIPDAARAAHRIHIRNFGETGVTTRSMHSPRQLTGLRAGNVEFPIEATISQVEAAGQKLYTVVLRDITERKRAEEELHRSERMAVAGRMAATVAHEINNPLESVTNALYLVERSSSLDAQSRDLVRIAQDELRRVVQITKLTLGFSRQDERVFSEVSPGEIIDNVLTLYGRKLKTLGVNVDKRYESQNTIKAVAGELRQVFSNLIVNAADALADTGDRLIIRINDSGDWRDLSRRGVRTSVFDNGSGIYAFDRRRLFEPFYSTKGQKGTGLGLWVSRGIVQKHGGSIRVRSSVSPGKSGTVFSVFLPNVPPNSDEGYPR